MPNGAQSGIAVQWAEAINLTCSVYSSFKYGQQRFEPRNSELSIQIDGAANSKRKLAGNLDLSAYATFQQMKNKVIVPLGQGVGNLHLVLSSVWLKQSLGEDDDDDASSIASGSSTASASAESKTPGCEPMDVSTNPFTPSQPNRNVVSTPDTSGPPTLLPRTPYPHMLTPKDAVSSRMSTPQSKVKFGISATAAPARKRSSLLRSLSHTSIAAERSAPAGILRSRAASATFKDFPQLTKRSNSIMFASPINSEEEVASSRSSDSSPKLSRRFSAAPTVKRSQSSPFIDVNSIGSTNNDSPWPAYDRKQRQPSLNLGDVRCESPLVPRSSAKSDVDDISEGRRSPTENGECSCSANVSSEAEEVNRSIIKVPLKNMEEVLFSELPLSLDELEQSLLGMDSEGSKFGKLLCAQLGYSQLNAGSWEGNESEGLEREVNLVVKCPPKPLLPDFTRVVVRHRLQRKSPETLILEREVGTLDVPYGDAFRVQERWVATQQKADGTSNLLELRVHSYVNFRGRVGLMASKIRHHSTKKSRKVATMAANLLRQAHTPLVHNSPQVNGTLGEKEGVETAELRALYTALLEETSYLKRKLSEVERENKKLMTASKHFPKSKQQLVEEMHLLRERLIKEQRERAAMEEMLTSAYNSIIRELIEANEAALSDASAHAKPCVTRASAPTPQRISDPGG